MIRLIIPITTKTLVKVLILLVSLFDDSTRSFFDLLGFDLSNAY